MEHQTAILVVHNDTAFSATIRTVLGSEQYYVVEAPVEQALETASKAPISAFLLDGAASTAAVGICRGIRELPEYNATPIILMIPAGAYTGLDAAFAAGCDDFINSPFNEQELKARLRGHLTRVNSIHELERRRRMLHRYLSKRTLEIVDTVAQMGVVPPPEEKNLSVLFTDMRGFTALSEDTSPQQLFDLVSSTLSAQVSEVHRFGGYVDKFGGDGLMAIFDGPDMVVQSCLCAREITKNAASESRAGIGIHTGKAMIGNIGSPEHLDYSAIGATVNIAARLCGQAEANSIAVSEAVRDAAQNDNRLKFHSGRLATIKGMRAPLKIFTLG